MIGHAFAGMKHAGWLDLTAQHQTTDQIEWIDMIGIVGLMRQAQPAGYGLSAHITKFRHRLIHLQQ